MTIDTRKSVHLRKQCAVVIRKPKLRVFDEYEALVSYVKNNPNASASDWQIERENSKQEQTDRFKDIIFTKGSPSSDKKKILMEVP